MMTAAIVTARFFGGNFESALDLLSEKGEKGYFGGRLSRSQFNRRLHPLASILESFFEWLGQVHEEASSEDLFRLTVVRFRSVRDRCRIYPKTATSGANRGYSGSRGELKRLLPESIHVVTACGFELKVFLFVHACSIEALLQATT